MTNQSVTSSNKIDDAELSHAMFSKSLVPNSFLHQLTSNNNNQMQFISPGTIAAAAAAAYYNSSNFSQIKSQSLSPVTLSPSSSSSSSSIYQRNYLEALRFYKAAYESK